MQISEVEITVADLPAAAAYYVEHLGLPVEHLTGTARVTVGSTTLVLRTGAEFAGDHHLAFDIAPEHFEATLAYARAHLSPIVVEDSDVIVGPANWDSRSVYWRGPEGIVLEYIAREAHRGHRPATAGVAPDALSVSEVGVGVADVLATVTGLEDLVGLPPFPPQSKQFAPVGDHHGLLILVDPDRIWFPTQDASAAHGPLAVTLRADGVRPVDLRLSPTSTLRTR